MASSTPPPHCSLTTSTTRPSQNHHHFHRPPHNPTSSPNNHQTTWTPQKFSLHHNHNHYHYAAPRPSSSSSSSYLSPSDFSGRRSTRFVSKMHFGRPRSDASLRRHSAAAEQVLSLALSVEGNDKSMDTILLPFESKLFASDDYTFLMRELGNRRECSKAMQCFQFAIARERRRNELGKLASSMISTLGRLGEIDLARDVFDNAVSEGYGNTVYAYSSLISAYAKSGYCDDAVRVFQTMKDSGLKPNLVTYNALIDACGKGGANYTRALDIFDDMVQNGVQPDRITYNSLLAVCSGAGLWESARRLFDEMVCRGIDQDIYTYNTLLDAACGGGQMDVAFEIMAEMPAKNILPNQVTYSTMIRGCAKAGRLDRALGLFNEMKLAGIKLDRVAYNTLLAIYASLGRFDEAFHIGKEMENIGIKKDVVTYNALLDGFGKQGMYNRVKELFAEMKKEHLSPNLLTYSTLISVYCKGDLYQEAMEVYREFKRQGLKADVVFYSKLIDALCKKGLAELSASLLEEMMREGIQPNVVTYNSIINAFGQSSSAAVPAVNNHLLDSQTGSSLKQQIVLPREGSFSNVVHHDKGNDDGIIEIFRQLACWKSGEMSEQKAGTQDFRCISSVFRKMHDMNIKPNVVTFSAILNACSRCNSFEEASLLLKELRLFDNKVYGVAHGLLMAHNENTWSQAVQLFDEVKRMDSSTASAFYNGLTDMLWHFGQKRGAQLVVLEGKRREVWENTWSISCLDLHLMSSGAAQAMVHAWLLNIRSIVYEGHELPKLLSILTGWGKHSKVVGDGALKRTVEALLINIGAPFRVASCNIGRFISTGAVVTSWLRESGTLKLLVLQDDRTSRSHSHSSNLDHVPNLQPISL